MTNGSTVLVVDDMALYRTVIGRALEEAGFTVVGKAANGAGGLADLQRLAPALMTLDLEMPGMGGLDVLREMAKLPSTVPRPQVVVFSAHSAEGAGVTLEALRLGAVDFVLKPTSADGMQAIKDRLIPALQALKPPPLAVRAIGQSPSRIPTTAIVKPPAAATLQLQQRRILIIASSTGGPPALERAFKFLPANFPVPILITQHMPPVFTKVMAEHLQRISRIRVVEADDGMVLEPGTAYVAPGDWHLQVNEVNHVARIHLVQSERIFGLRPAADVMFPSVAKIFGGKVLAAIFTGMGSDGTAGGKVIKAAGAALLTQTRESCVVYGMPAAADDAGLADGHFTPETFAETVAAYQLRW